MELDIFSVCEKDAKIDLVVCHAPSQNQYDYILANALGTTCFANLCNKLGVVDYDNIVHPSQFSP